MFITKKSIHEWGVKYKGKKRDILECCLPAITFENVFATQSSPASGRHCWGFYSEERFLPYSWGDILRWLTHVQMIHHPWVIPVLVTRFDEMAPQVLESVSHYPYHYSITNRTGVFSTQQSGQRWRIPGLWAEVMIRWDFCHMIRSFRYSKREISEAAVEIVCFL